MKNMLILFQRNIVGGNTTYTLNLILQLSSLLNVTVICSPNNYKLLSLFLDDKIDGIRVVVVKTKFFIVSEMFNLQKEIIKNKYDYIFSPNTLLPFVFFSKKVKKIITIHDLNFKFLKFPFFHRLYKEILYIFSFRFSDYVIFISQKTEKDVERFYNVFGKKKIIWNGVDNEWLKQKVTEASLKEKYFVSFGHHAHKNIEGSIDFTKKYNEKYNENYKLYVIGESEYLRRVREFYKNDDGIVFLGRIDQSDLISLIGKSKCLLFLSKFEGFGLPVFEAFALGTPVVISPLDALLEVSQGKAIVYDPLKHDDAIVQLYQLLSNDEKYDRHAIELRNYVTPFSWEKTAKNIIEFLNAEKV